MSNGKIHHTYDNLYDRVRGDGDTLAEDVFQSKVEALVNDGFIETSTLDDFTLYSAKSGLKWSDFVDIDDLIKKSILLLLVDNPTTFFVLQNTQKGKMRIASLEIKRWGQDRTKKVVAFIIVDNDKTLADQSVDGLQRVFGDQKVRIFPLSSNSKIKFDEIKTYIDAYASDIVQEGCEPEYPMPLIALLGNVPQNEKMLRLLQHIDTKVSKHKSLLRYGIIWDEADKTYVALRDKAIKIDEVSVSCYTFIVQRNNALYRLGFVTATDGNLLDEEYPECANAYLYPVEIAPEDHAHYRALHHKEAKTHKIPFTSKHTNNSYATEILESKKDHFTKPIILPSGEVYYRKIIVNSNAKTEDMVSFAKSCNKGGMHAMVFNGYGGASVKVYKVGKAREEGKPTETHKSKGKRFNELLFYIYKKLDLSDKPLVIIGRRKVDRGLGFHYCPRTNDPSRIEGSLGDLNTQDREGLVWTDEILGRIENKNIAVQKAGRLAGIIGNSPQYPGEIHFWTDEYTENLIRRHNTIVDNSNTLSGCSVRQAIRHAESITPIVPVSEPPVDPNTYRIYSDETIVKSVFKILDYHYKKTSENSDGFKETSLRVKKGIVSLEDAVKHVPSAHGGGAGGTQSRRYYPCYVDTTDKATLRFVVIIEPAKKGKLVECDGQFPPIPYGEDFSE